MEKLVRKAHQNDLTDIAEIHHKSFIRQADSKQWIASTLAAYPRFFCHVIVSDKTVGYIFWAQKSGFREEVILELDQIAIHPDFQGLGLSKKLIIESLKDVENELLQRNQKIKDRKKENHEKFFLGSVLISFLKSKDVEMNYLDITLKMIELYQTKNYFSREVFSEYEINEFKSLSFR